jgi:hypothetical protein
MAQTLPGLVPDSERSMIYEFATDSFTPGEIGKIGGGNFCRVFAKVTAGRA